MGLLQLAADGLLPVVAFDNLRQWLAHTTEFDRSWATQTLYCCIFPAGSPEALKYGAEPEQSVVLIKNC